MFERSIPVPPSRPMFRAIFSLIAIALFILPALISGANADTYVFDGTMSSTMHVTETANVHVTGLNMAGLANGSKIIYNMTIPDSSSVDGFSQSVSNVNMAVTTAPTGVPYTSSDQTDSYGNHYKMYIFNMDGFTGSTMDITCTALFDASITGNAGKVNYLDGIGSTEYSQYRAPTSVVQSDDPAIINKKNQLLSGVTTEAQAVDKIIDFVRVQIPNQASGTAKDANAVSSLSSNTGTCVNRAYLSLALLRSAGIPCRYVTGMLYGNTITYTLKNGGSSQANWGSGLHAWIEVYYPQEHVWVPYDPFMDKGFIDTRHVKSGISVDGNSKDRATHGDFNLALASGVNPSVNADISNGISVSNLNDNQQFTPMYSKSSPAGQTMFAREMQYSPTAIPSLTPTPAGNHTPTPLPSNHTPTPVPTTTITATPLPGQGSEPMKYNLSGAITDADTGAAVQNAVVKLDAISVSANPSGKFTFLYSLTSNAYQLSVEAPGYVSDRRTITGNNADMDVNVQLKASSAATASTTPTPSPAPALFAFIIVLSCVALILRRKGGQ